MNPPYEEDFTKLNALVSETEHHREKECRAFIPLALDLFVPFTASTTVLGDETEYPGHTGPSDLIIFCERHCAGVSEKYAYIWEVKSPQTTVFVQDTEYRVKPSSEFIQAENQLLHYWEDCKTEKFREEFNLSHLDHIMLGGILIGKTSTLVKGNYDETKKNRLYKTALNLRKKCFYNNCIQVLIWDDVLNFIRPAVPITENKQGDIGSVSISSESQSVVISNDPYIQQINTPDPRAAGR